MLRQGDEQQELSARVHRAWTPLARALAATGDRWTLTIVLALASGRTRLTELHRRLPGASKSVLEHHLQRMVAAELVTRTRSKAPPRVELELTDAGHELVVVAGMLARWGMRHRWSEPAGGERIDVGALLRMLPILLDEHPGLPEGAAVEAQVTSTHALIVVFYRVRGGRLQIDGVLENEHGMPPSSDASDLLDGVDELLRSGAGAPPSATVCLQGDERAWIAALGPDGDYGHLHVRGKTELAKRLLDGLPHEAPSQ